MNDYKLCIHCNETKTINNFYKKPKISSYCKNCVSIQTKERQRKFKLKCLEYKGNKCLNCGYNRCNGVLEFHHIDPNEKDFNISSVKTHKFNNKVIKELDKCILLCSNCHREIHNNILNYDVKTNKFSYVENLDIEHWNNKNHFSISEQIDFHSDFKEIKSKNDLILVAQKYNTSQKYIRELFASKGLYFDFNSRKKITIDKDELQKLLWEMPTTKIAKILNVSDVAIKKFANKNGLTKPPRGYWTKIYNNKL